MDEVPDTIYALSSAPGRAAIAVVRASGPAVPAILAAMVHRPVTARQASHAYLHHPRTDAVLDDAVVLYFPSPNSFTGEHVVEFHIHGGRAVVAAILGALGAISGTRPAEAGEFANRAFLNGKLDLTAAEGIADLIDAETEAQRRQAVRQAGGELEGLYERWRAGMIEAMSLVESAIDFSDEGDVSETAYAGAICRIQSLKTGIMDHLSGWKRAEIIRQGFQVVISGPPNVGKSTLLNALAKRDAAIVSSTAGTTRDIIEVHLDLEGLPFVVTDTAGIRETSAEIEKEGIRRALDRAQKADLVLWVTAADGIDDSKPPSEITSQQTPIVKVINKCDLVEGITKHSAKDILPISAKNGSGLERLTDKILAAARAMTDAEDQPAIAPTTARQKHHLEDAVSHLQRFLSSSERQDTNQELELRAEDLRLAAASLARLTGRIDAEDILDQIFSRFCIGK